MQQGRDKCKIGTANVLSDHSFLAMFDSDGEYAGGYGLNGTEAKGELPKAEGADGGGGWQQLDKNDCKRCKRDGSRKLKFGTGAPMARTGASATDQDIIDCIKNHPATQDYNVILYNCHTWRIEAAANCGLDCHQ